jgi:hypothetical protein
MAPSQLHKEDLDLVLEVNRKSIELQSEVAEQNEEVISSLNDIKAQQITDAPKLDKIIEQNEQLSRDIFTMRIFYIMGILSIVAQLVQIFLKH